MHTVVETRVYLRDAKDAGLTEAERLEIVGWLSVHPDAGDEIKHTGGARKVRFAGKGKGKSAGYRVITFYSGPDIPVFLLNIFAKGEKVNLTQSERNELRDVLAELGKSYRERRK